MSERKKSRPWLTAGIALCVLIVLLAGYVGAYYFTVAADDVTFGSASPLYVVQDEIDESGSLQRLFAPIHWLDRRIRPDTWEVKPFLSPQQARVLQDYRDAQREKRDSP